MTEVSLLSGNGFAQPRHNDIMTPLTRQTAPEQLWSAPDGTVCILEEQDTAPMYTISLIRDAEVVRQERLFAKASAEMVALSWRHRTVR